MFSCVRFSAARLVASALCVILRPVSAVSPAVCAGSRSRYYLRFCLLMIALLSAICFRLVPASCLSVRACCFACLPCFLRFSDGPSPSDALCCFSLVRCRPCSCLRRRFLLLFACSRLCWRASGLVVISIVLFRFLMSFATRVAPFVPALRCPPSLQPSSTSCYWSHLPVPLMLGVSSRLGVLTVLSCLPSRPLSCTVAALRTSS